MANHQKYRLMCPTLVGPCRDVQHLPVFDVCVLRIVGVDVAKEAACQVIYPKKSSAWWCWPSRHSLGWVERLLLWSLWITQRFGDVCRIQNGIQWSDGTRSSWRSCCSCCACQQHIWMTALVAGSTCGLDGVAMQLASAFLQGKQPDWEQHCQLYALIQRTGNWTAKLYRVRGIIYRLPNAPHLCTEEVVARLEDVKPQLHSFDRMVFCKRRDPEEPTSPSMSIVSLHWPHYGKEGLHPQLWGEQAGRMTTSLSWRIRGGVWPMVLSERKVEER